MDPGIVLLTTVVVAVTVAGAASAMVAALAFGEDIDPAAPRNRGRCGYSRQGLTGAVRCPECGLPPEESVRTVPGEFAGGGLWWWAITRRMLRDPDGFFGSLAILSGGRQASAYLAASHLVAAVPLAVAASGWLAAEPFMAASVLTLGSVPIWMGLTLLNAGVAAGVWVLGRLRSPPIPYRAAHMVLAYAAGPASALICLGTLLGWFSREWYKSGWYFGWEREHAFLAASLGNLAFWLVWGVWLQALIRSGVEHTRFAER